MVTSCQLINNFDYVQKTKEKSKLSFLTFSFSEFCPGVPWKGLQNIDPETDPNVTPGSVPSGPTINTNIQDVNRYLLRDRSGGEKGLKRFQKQSVLCDGVGIKLTCKRPPEQQK